MEALEAALDAEAERTAFSGVVRVDRLGAAELAKAYGLADRAHGIPNTFDTRFMLASVAKGFTALAVMSLVADGTLLLSTTARSVLGGDLPLIADDVTVEHLLAHRSGIGDYRPGWADDRNSYTLSVTVGRSTRPSGSPRCSTAPDRLKADEAVLLQQRWLSCSL
jgi:CubicO group peptidase (beta-lactamase class C family)